ncbi:MAG TPA: FAD-dependent oxidoreductase [Acidimicrobiales bacterium]|nr:FAD-dependent oxidoreductase [Acidimicrobiales bacterium]
MKIVVLGAGIAGLGTALALGRYGHDVTLVERDDVGSAVDAEDAFSHRGRQGAPQTRHSHAFLARTRNLLAAEAPDVLEVLARVGVQELRFTDDLPPEMDGFVPEPADEELVALACRRTTFEWVLRDKVLDAPTVRLVYGRAAGVALSSGMVATGVELEDGRVISADAVVDAMGRRSPMVAWIEAAGGRRPAETSADTGIVYSTRFYRLSEGADRPHQEGPIGGDLGYMKYAIFPADNRTFSITFAVPTTDAALRVLLRQVPFDRAALAMPATSAWVEPGRSEPMTSVDVMARLVNRKVDFVIDGRPVVTGLYAVGDSHICTNPLYGRGCSLALVHAFALERVLRDHDPASVDAALAFHEETAQELVPWYDAAVAQDAETAESAATGLGNLVRDGLLPAARRDPQVMRAFLRAFNLLAPPASAMADPYVIGKVLEAYQEREVRPVVRLGPERGELLEAIA